MKTVACLLVDTPKVFQVVGHMSLLHWVTERIADVRGIDKIVCAVHAELAKQTERAITGHDIEILTIPKELRKTPDRGIYLWLGTRLPASDITLFTKPTTPFLPAGKIEKCVALVAKNKATKTWPARAVRSLEEPMRLTVYRNNAKTEVTKTVPVSLIESLDADEADEFVLISALVESGKM